MTYPDFRAICAELVNELDLVGFDDEYSENLLKKAKNALATSKMRPLNDDQLEGIFHQNAKCIIASSYLDLQGFLHAFREAFVQSLRAR